MDRILTVEQMQQADSFTINTLGISENELINRAGIAVSEEIINRYHGGRVLVCIGKGNNGKDGEVIARILSQTHGFKVRKICLPDGNLEIFADKFDIIVDCIFGTGLNRDVDGVYKSAIEKINESRSVKVSCDIPSGLNGDNGMPMGVAVKADLTVAIQEYKSGHFLCDAPDYCGDIILKDIGISVWDDDLIYRINSDDIKSYFPKRKRNTHKGSYGNVTIIGGSKKYTGSAMLSLNALTALKMGVGYSRLIVPNSLLTIYAGKYPECIVSTIKDVDGEVCFDEKTLNEALNSNVIAVGMGIGVSVEIYKILDFLLKNFTGTLVIDADGLNTLALFGVDVLLNKKCRVVITPHIGEFSRLTKLDKKEILKNPIKIAKRFAVQYNVTVALKSSATLITDGTATYLNTTGTTALAKAGSGDVLCGISAGVLTRSENLPLGMAGSCYILGKSAEIACAEQGNEYTVTASDVVSSINKVISRL